MSFSFHEGSLLDDNADVLVNPTNAVGVMGKGLALGFAKRWPQILSDYRRDCASGALVGGSCRLYDLPVTIFERGHRRQWAAFCTKQNWRYPSRYEWIESGLRQLVAGLQANGHRSVAIPPLGCGNGGLEWERVEPMILNAFAGTDFAVKIWKPQMQNRNVPHPKQG